MRNYQNLLKEILLLGTEKSDRTGTGTISLFSNSLRFMADSGFPLVTTKKVNYNAVLHELLWFISGATTIKTLNSKIWNEWATEEGDIGPMYGYQWRNWKTSDGTHIDQLKTVIENIKVNPNSRRHIVSAWNVEYLPDESISPQDNVKNNKMALAPCHHFYQFYINGNKLSLHFSMRSTDAFLGLPFNIASYATLLAMVCKLTGYEPGMLSYHGVDIHLYKNHIEQVKTQLERQPYPLPTLKISGNQKTIDDFKFEDFELVDYYCHEPLFGKISV